MSRIGKTTQPAVRSATETSGKGATRATRAPQASEWSTGRGSALRSTAAKVIGNPRQQAPGVRPAFPAPGSPPPGMPRLDPSKVTVKGGSLADVEKMLTLLWENGGATGQACVTDLVKAANANGLDVNLGVDLGGAYMKAGPAGSQYPFSPAVLNVSPGGIPLPTDFAGQARVMMSLVHEFQHLGPQAAYSGTTYGEALAYKVGYDFLRDDLGLSPQEIRQTLGPIDPTYVLGTMQREYGITISNAFLEMMRKDLGVSGTGLPNDVISGSNTGSTSSSPLAAAGLSEQDLFEIAQDIATPNADVRHLSDDPADANR